MRDKIADRRSPSRRIANSLCEFKFGFMIISYLIGSAASQLV
jgi:hypothetical protein